MRKRSGSSGRGGRVAASVRRTQRKIDFSDIPDPSAEQLRVMRRLGQPPLGEEPRQLIAIRVDPGVLDQFRKEARRRRVGYQTLINEVLARHVRKTSRKKERRVTATGSSAIPAAFIVSSRTAPPDCNCGERPFVDPHRLLIFPIVRRAPAGNGDSGARCAPATA